MTLIQQLENLGYLRTEAIISAFQRVKRAEFLPADLKSAAELNSALPIGFGQTISQPLVVAFMLEELQPQKGQTVLDIGAGSGWTTALLAALVGPKGQILSVEVVPALCRLARENVAKFAFKNVEFRSGHWQKVVREDERFDRIQAAATASTLPRRLIDLLKSPGRLVIPVEEGQSGDHAIKTVVKDERGKLTEATHPGFRFVPMVRE